LTGYGLSGCGANEEVSEGKLAWSNLRHFSELSKEETTSNGIKTPGVNFTNVLSAAFTLVGPKSAKGHYRLECLFCAFGIYVRKSCT